MTTERYNQLMNIQNLQEEPEMTDDEKKQGWHYCWEFDGLLVGPEMKSEWQCCTCHEDKSIYEGNSDMPRKFSTNTSGDGKVVYIFGPWNLIVEIDHDDVNHDVVDREISKLVQLLDKHWRDGE